MAATAEQANLKRQSTLQRNSFAASLALGKPQSCETTMHLVEAGHIPDMSKTVFEQFLGFPGVAALLQDNGVDAVYLLQSMDMIFEEKVEQDENCLRFVDFVDVVLNMRGTNPATVKDVKEQMRLFKRASLEANQKTANRFTSSLDKMRRDVMMALNEIRRTIDSDFDSEEEHARQVQYASHDRWSSRKEEVDEDEESIKAEEVPESRPFLTGTFSPTVSVAGETAGEKSRGSTEDDVSSFIEPSAPVSGIEEDEISDIDVFEDIVPQSPP